MMNTQIIELRPLSVCDTNSYIAVSSEGNAVLIDAPDKADYILGEIEDRGLTLKKILLTHGHFDHVGAVAELAEKTGCEVYIHELDFDKLAYGEGLLDDFFRIRGIRSYGGAVKVHDGDIIRQDELEFDVLHTPGHTSGSVCYIMGDVLFSGDTLFARSMGRTDMPDGDEAAIMDSLRIIGGLGGDLRVLPGHMQETTLDEERRRNPYMIQAVNRK